MHTAQRLEQAIELAKQRGYEVRLEPLCGTTGGLCELGKRRIIFVDLSLTVAEQLDQVVSALRPADRQTPVRSAEAA